MSNDDEAKEKETARKVIEEWNKEQVRKKEYGISVSNAIRLHDENATVRGMIISISQPFKMITGRIDVCENTSCSNKQTTPYNKPQFSIHNDKSNKGCPVCNNNESFHILYTYTNAVRIKLQDEQPDSELEQLDVILFEENTKDIRPGEIVKIIGHIEVEQNSIKRGNLYSVLHAQSIKYERMKELEVTSKNIKSFEKFAKMPKVIDRLVSLLAPNVIGHQDKKLGILRSAVGAPENNHRGRIHTLFIGTPGLAKSMLARAAAEIVPNSRFVTAQHASGKGITAIIDKENDTTILRLGAVPQARGGICAINELGQMDYQDQAFLLDSMEEGEFTIDKYAIHIRIKSPTTIVATTNPIGFKWNDPYKVSNTEMPIMRPLLDRFDQIFTFSEFASIEENRQYAQKKAEMNEENIRYNSNFLRPFLSYAKTIDPKIPHEVQSMIIDYWLQLKEKGIASNRTLDSLFRISKAQARLHLSEIVNIEIVTEVMNQYGRMALQYGEIVNIIESPRDVTYKEMLNIVKTANAPIELTEVAKIACKKNEQIKGYLGTKLNLKYNSKLQAIKGMLLNDPSVKQVNEKPIVLAWLAATSVVQHIPNNINENVEHEEIVRIKENKDCDLSDACDTRFQSMTRYQSNCVNGILVKENKELERGSQISHPSHSHNDLLSTKEDSNWTNLTNTKNRLLQRETKQESEEQQHDKQFICFYCDDSFSCDKERVDHISYEHPGKMFYPTPDDFNWRLER